MTHVTIEIISLGTSLAALSSTVVVVDWPNIRSWYAHLWDEERRVIEQDAAQYAREALMYPPVGEDAATLDEFMRRVGPPEAAPEAKHPLDGAQYSK